MTRLIFTSDGTFTLFSETFKVTYHSIHGAAQESRHVFIGPGLTPWLKKNEPEIKVFEMGFGTGLNCLLTYEAARSVSYNGRIHYEAVEQFPLEAELVEELAKAYGRDEASERFFKRIHDCNWNREEIVVENFSLHKRKNDLLSFQPENSFHCIYFDAFDPATQPELWEEAVFRKLFDMLVTGGTLVTYSAKGEVKRRLKRVGFTVETLAGPPGKREMVRAVKG